jgi:hypothetical protein
MMAFGRATWPHMLCRAMLAEQLYRAEMILKNHPYHRGNLRAAHRGLLAPVRG